MSCTGKGETILMSEDKLTLEDGQNALAGHVVEKALALREKYGDDITYEKLFTIFADEEFLRYPTKMEFNSAELDQGMFAAAKKVSKNPNDGFIIFVHEYFRNRLSDVPPLVLYHLVSVNYGDFATHKEAELFGAAVLDMEKEEYYQHICRLADQINTGQGNN